MTDKSPPKPSKEIPADKLSELEAAHGEILVVTTVLGQAAFRNPKRVEYQRFQQQLHNDKQRHMAGETLVRTCVVYPDLPTFDGWIDRKSGIISTCANKLIEFAGSDAEAEEKKFGSA